MDNKVIVVGGGLAGLSAAFELVKHGSYPVVIDKAGALGGNSAKATSGVNAVGTKYQSAREDIEDSVDLFIEDTMKAGHNLNDPDLVRTLCALSGRAVDTAIDDFGFNLEDIQQLGGHSTKRTHRFPPKDGRPVPVGWTITSTMRKKLEELVGEGKAEIMLNTEVRDIELEEVEGNDGKKYDRLKALTIKNATSNEETVLRDFKAAIFSVGGYAANSRDDSVLAKYRPDLVGFPTTNDAFATGDIVEISLKKGFSGVNLDKVQLHPTGFVDAKDPGAPKKFLCPEVMRGLGAILLTTEGKRFVDELLPRDKVSAAIREAGSPSQQWGLIGDSDPRCKVVLMVMGQDIAEAFGMEPFNFYMKRGLIHEVTKDDFAEKIPVVPFDTLAKTVQEYDQIADGQLPDPFNKVTFPNKIGNVMEEKFYVAYITPALHFTMGGILIDTAGRMMKEDGRPVLNMFAAGEASGGVHGGNRLGGNGCLESTVFGQLTGQLAATIKGEQKLPQLTLKPHDDTVVLKTTTDSITVALPNLDALTDSKAAGLVLRSGLKISSAKGDAKGHITNVVDVVQQTPGTLTIHFTPTSELSGSGIYPGDRVSISA